jgi:hypothetical protein
MVAMHLRRGDKYSLHPKHMRNHSWRVHPESFALWGRRVAANLGADRVLCAEIIGWTSFPGELCPWRRALFQY